MTATLNLDALEQATWAQPLDDMLVHHRKSGHQYLGIRYSGWLTAEEITSSAGTAETSATTPLPRPSTTRPRPRSSDTKAAGKGLKSPSSQLSSGFASTTPRR